MKPEQKITHCSIFCSYYYPLGQPYHYIKHSHLCYIFYHRTTALTTHKYTINWKRLDLFSHLPTLSYFGLSKTQVKMHFWLKINHFYISQTVYPHSPFSCSNYQLLLILKTLHYIHKNLTLILTLLVNQPLFKQSLSNQSTNYNTLYINRSTILNHSSLSIRIRINSTRPGKKEQWYNLPIHLWKPGSPL